MSIAPRHIVAALAGALLLGTVGGGLLAAAGGDSIAESRIGFTPDAEPQTEQVAIEEEKPAATGEFTAAAAKQGKRIVITGEGAAPGAKLVVQRKESTGWQDFPARATATGDGSYSTYIITSRDGMYRVKDTASDAASKPVEIDA